MKQGDKVMVSAEATGLGKPMEAVIDKVETFLGQTLVTVTYTHPNALSGLGGCFVDVHITLNECPHVTKLAKFKLPSCPKTMFWNTLCKI